MAPKPRRPFDPKAFLAHVGDGRSIGRHRKGQIVFSQGEPADAVFFIQRGKVKITVVSEQGMRRSSRSLEPTISSAKGALPDRSTGWQQSQA